MSYIYSRTKQIKKLNIGTNTNALATARQSAWDGREISARITKNA